MLAATALAQTERDASPSPTMISPTAPNGTTTRIFVEPPTNPPAKLLVAAGQGEDNGCCGTSKILAIPASKKTVVHLSCHSLALKTKLNNFALQKLVLKNPL